MARCPYEKLEDIEDVLEKIRALPLIKESKPGIFYYKSQGFLHFHLKDDRRWADVRDTDRWGSEMDLPFKAKKSEKNSFFDEVKRRYNTLNNP